MGSINQGAVRGGESQDFDRYAGNQRKSGEPSNLSRTLKTLSHYGIIEMRREKRHVRPIAKATEFRIVAS